MFQTYLRILRQEMAADGAADGILADADNTDSNNADQVLDDNAPESILEDQGGSGSFTVEDFLTNFDEDNRSSAETYARKYADDNGNIKLAELAKAGFNSQKMFGGFTGAPDAYEIATPDYLEGDVSHDDPYVQEFMELAKGANMNQDTFGKLMDVHLRASIAPPVSIEVMRESIGDDFDQMRTNMAGFYKNKLAAEDFKSLESMITNPEAFKALHSVFQASRPTKIEDKIRDDFNQKDLSSQMEAEFNAKDEYGAPKMQNPIYAKGWRERWSQFIDESA